jgi:hypothetical protein
MAAVRYNLRVEQGAVFTASWEWREDDGSDPPAGPLIDVTDYEPQLHISRDGEEVEDVFTLANGLSIVDGVIELRIGADVTADWVRSGQYDLELHHRTDPSDVVRLSSGSVLVDPQVSP